MRLFLGIGLFFTAALIISLLTFGGGYLLSMVTPLNLEFASIVFILSVFLIGIVLVMIFSSETYNKEVWQDSVEGDLNKVLDVFDDMEKPNLRNNRKTKKQIKTIRRNRLCSCGSGKKYHSCCFKKSQEQPEVIPF